MLQKPTVGRAVHFYNDALPASANNGMGPGPYAAVISQIHGSADDADPYVSLTVFPPFAAPLSEGSVKLEGTRRYAWPPRA